MLSLITNFSHHVVLEIVHRLWAINTVDCSSSSAQLFQQKPPSVLTPHASHLLGQIKTYGDDTPVRLHPQHLPASRPWLMGGFNTLRCPSWFQNDTCSQSWWRGLTSLHLVMLVGLPAPAVKLLQMTQVVVLHLLWSGPKRISITQEPSKMSFRHLELHFHPLH